mmetsp:Transcript_21544/g.53904  ORF Transcript_21544/g.53904 Transcript_21544/m.53904 type:complete len:201 (+) Transcript_21544:76-678(+)
MTARQSLRTPPRVPRETKLLTIQTSGRASDGRTFAPGELARVRSEGQRRTEPMHAQHTSAQSHLAQQPIAQKPPASALPERYSSKHAKTFLPYLDVRSLAAASAKLWQARARSLSGSAAMTCKTTPGPCRAWAKCGKSFGSWTTARASQILSREDVCCIAAPTTPTPEGLRAMDPTFCSMILRQRYCWSAVPNSNKCWIA